MARTFRGEQNELTEVQVEILARHASGKPLKRVAEEVFCSYSSVANHIHSAKQKLQTKTLAATVMRAHQLGYLSHPTGVDGAVFPLR